MTEEGRDGAVDAWLEAAGLEPEGMEKIDWDSFVMEIRRGV